MIRLGTFTADLKSCRNHLASNQFHSNTKLKDKLFVVADHNGLKEINDKNYLRQHKFIKALFFVYSHGLTL